MSKAPDVLLGGAVVVLLAPACGGSPEQRPAASPANAAGEEGAPRPAEAPAYPGAEAPATADATGRAPSAELARAEAQLQAAQGDCAAACRALASMQRATDHLCAIAGEPDDRQRCEDAKRRLLAARDRVRSSCGDCR